jgi:hypothetical protein
MAASKIPPPQSDRGARDAELARRGEQVIQALSRVRPAGGGAAARKAPSWAHALLDLLWDLLFPPPL